MSSDEEDWLPAQTAVLLRVPEAAAAIEPQETAADESEQEDWHNIVVPVPPQQLPLFPFAYDEQTASTVAPSTDDVVVENPVSNVGRPLQSWCHQLGIPGPAHRTHLEHAAMCAVARKRQGDEVFGTQHGKQRNASSTGMR